MKNTNVCKRLAMIAGVVLLYGMNCVAKATESAADLKLHPTTESGMVTVLFAVICIAVLVAAFVCVFYYVKNKKNRKYAKYDVYSEEDDLFEIKGEEDE